MPAPSPVSGSQPQAPRWPRFTRASRPRPTIAFDRSPAMLATKATPQASCSWAGSYRPWGISLGMGLVLGMRWYGRMGAESARRAPAEPGMVAPGTPFQLAGDMGGRRAFAEL